MFTGFETLKQITEIRPYVMTLTLVPEETAGFTGGSTTSITQGFKVEGQGSNYTLLNMDGEITEGKKPINCM